ncbi:MAG: hypothetical protein IH606_24330 [Burkholderiales bacterium]|nr:hypothetical protein [Burkholderiales bacterium]
MKNPTFGIVLAAVALFSMGLPGRSAAAAIAIEDRSAVVMQQGDPLAARIEETSLGRELVVSFTASDRTSAGERLIAATFKMIMRRADGSVLPTDIDIVQVSPGERKQWRVPLKPAGTIDAAQIAKIVVQNIYLSTAERSEREVRESVDADRQANQARAQVQRRAALERERKIRARKWPPEIERAVIAEKVIPGMNADQVTLAWGRPREVNETGNAAGKPEQWVYLTRGKVNFENGRVASVQDAR